MKEMLIPGFLGRTHGAYLASVRLALSGQVTEAYMVSRGCLENGLYASYIKADPTIKEENPERTKIWMERDENEDSLRKFRKVFSASKVLKNVEEIESRLGSKARKLYEFAIRQGAHPNIGGLVTTSKISLKGGTIDLLQRGDQLTCKICVQTITQVGVCCLKIFTVVAGDRVIKTGIQRQLESIEGMLEGGILKNDSR